MRLAFLLCSGCLIGGGPMVGYDRHGWFGGVEIGAGGAVILPQLALGYQTRNSIIYARLDETFDVSGLTSHWTIGVPGGRIGGGLGVSTDSGDVSGMFAVGPSFGARLSGTRPSCNDVTTEALVEVQLRYIAGWQVVLAPRVEVVGAGCIK